MQTPRLPFQVAAEAPGSRARAGAFRTLHGEVRTPTFMPVGTRATVKAQLTQTLEECGAQVLLANTYHLLLRPGPEVFERLGGIHKFMTWERSVLTDSGGFQIFSLPKERAMLEEGALFKNPFTGRDVLLSPEVSIGMQRSIGSDIMMALDQCIPSTADHATARAALELTQRWAVRSLEARGDSPQALFGIVQGALFKDLRQLSAERLTALPFDGFAIGGLAVGEGREARESMCEFTAPLLPATRPRYLMGVGTPLDILEAVHRGMDMFDCIMPTQLAQRGGVFTSRGFLQMRRGVYRFAEEALDPACGCPTCRRYSRAYLHHLTKSKETLGWQLLGAHNLHFYQSLMRDIRASILDGSFLRLYHERRAYLHAPDLDHPTDGKPSTPRPSGPPRVLGAYAIHEAQPSSSSTSLGLSIVHRPSGAVMHPPAPPTGTSRLPFIGNATDRLLELLRTPDPANEPVVLWDVTMGTAGNAMAAVACYEEAAAAGPLRPLHLISFEDDPDLLRLALLHHGHFTYLRHAGPPALLRDGAWQSRKFPGLQWRLVQGDFPVAISEPSQPLPRPHLVLHDCFATQRRGAQWTRDAFAALASACATHDTELHSADCSPQGRAALLAGGFHAVHPAPGDGGSEATLALTASAAARRASAPRPGIG